MAFKGAVDKKQQQQQKLRPKDTKKCVRYDSSEKIVDRLTRTSEFFFMAWDFPKN